MYVCVYVSPTFRFSGRHHTDSITPSFFSNPRLGSSDRQPREGILRWSCQPNHHVAAPHSRSNTRWDPQVWLHPANGAAEPAVSIYTYIPLISALPFFYTAPVAFFLPQCIALAPWGFICPPCPSSTYMFLSPLLISFSLLVCLLWVSGTQTCPREKCCWVKDVAKRFKQQEEAFGKLSWNDSQKRRECFF